MLLTLIAGLSDGVLLFLVASGLSLIFGVLGVLNFSHGGFFALGAFVTHTLTRGAQLEAWQFVAVALAGGLLVGGLGLGGGATSPRLRRGDGSTSLLAAQPLGAQASQSERAGGELVAAAFA